MLRSPTDEDRERVRAWRNHPQVRAMSFTTHEITASEHAAWWERVVADPARSIHVFEHEGIPAGVVTFEQQDDGVVEWGFYLDVDGLESRGQLLGAWFAIFGEGIDHAFGTLGASRLHGDVLTDNQAVRQIHRRFGFAETDVHERDIDGRPREVAHVELREDVWRDRQERKRT